MSWIDLIGFGEHGRGGILLWAMGMTLAVTGPWERFRVCGPSTIPPPSGQARG